MAHQGVRIASAGSKFFGARIIADRLTERSGVDVNVETDHGHLLFDAALTSVLDADIVLLPDSMIDTLISKGAADNLGRVEIGTVSIAAATGKAGQIADVSHRGALIKTLIEADEIILTNAPTGTHILGVIAQLNLTTLLAEKIRRFDKSKDVNAYLVSQAGKQTRTVAFGPATEILAWKDKGVIYGGLIANEFQIRLPYSATLLTVSENVPAARAVLSELNSEEAHRAFAETGVEYIEPEVG